MAQGESITLRSPCVIVGSHPTFDAWYGMLPAPTSTLKHSCAQDSTRCVHIRSHKLFLACVLSYLWTSSEKGVTNSWVNIHIVDHGPFLVWRRQMAGKACSNQLVRSDMNASGPVLLRTGFKSVLGGGGMSRQGFKVGSLPNK